MGKILHAGKSGYFPFCLQEGTGYWSLEKAMEIYWRIRSWEFSLSVTYLAFSDLGEEQIFTTTPTPLGPAVITSLVTTEEDLVCGNSLNRFLHLEATPTKSGSLYNPGFGVDVNWGSEYDFGFAEFQVFSGAGGPDVRSFSIYGSSSFPLSFIVYERPEISFSLLDATLSLEPKSWWSYGGTYDTSTGARL